MSQQEFQIAVIAIVFGSAIAITFFIVLGTMINSWIKNRSGNNLADNEEFLEALRQFKQKTDRRLSNLEAIVVDEEPKERKKAAISPPSDSKSIEIEDDDEKDPNKSSSGGSLKNMLSK